MELRIPLQTFTDASTLTGLDVIVSENLKAADHIGLTVERGHRRRIERVVPDVRDRCAVGQPRHLLRTRRFGAETEREDDTPGVESGVATYRPLPLSSIPTARVCR